MSKHRSSNDNCCNSNSINNNDNNNNNNNNAHDNNSSRAGSLREVRGTRPAADSLYIHYVYIYI